MFPTLVEIGLVTFALTMSIYIWVMTKFLTQGAGTPFDLPTKVSAHGTCVFWCKTTWGTTFTKVILLRMGRALYCFWKKTFQLLNKVLEGRQIGKSLLKRKCGENFCFTIIDFSHIFSLVNFFARMSLLHFYLVTQKFFFKNSIPLLPFGAKWL